MMTDHKQVLSFSIYTLPNGIMSTVFPQAEPVPEYKLPSIL